MSSSARGNFSFDESRLEAIERGNSHLLTRLHEIATRPVSSARTSASAGSARASSSHTINRKKRDAEIERQNMLLLRRLQSAKPTVGKTGASVPKPRAAAGGAGAASAAAADTSPLAMGPGGRPAWVDPLSARPALESLGSTAASVGGAAAAGGAGLSARSDGGSGAAAGGAYAVGKPLSPEKLASTRRSVYGRASMGGTARVGGRMTGVPPPRGGFGEVDPRDLMLSACREDHLTRGR